MTAMLSIAGGEMASAQGYQKTTVTYADGSKYVGELYNGLFHGQGTLTWANGDKYEGAWKNGQHEGQGSYYWINGDVYVGAWSNGNRNGQGSISWTNGNIYTGAWVNNKKEGQGIYLWANGNKYEGTWKNDKMDGQGTFTWATGDVYVGAWKNDQIDGQGTMKYANGKVLAGQWVKGNLFVEDLATATFDPQTATMNSSTAKQTATTNSTVKQTASANNAAKQTANTTNNTAKQTATTTNSNTTKQTTTTNSSTAKQGNRADVGQYTISPSKVLYKQDFETQGKEYTMYFVDQNRGAAGHQDEVTSIVFMPSDYYKVIRDGVELNQPPVFQYLIYHKTNNGNSISAYVMEKCRNGNDIDFVKRELPLPASIANQVFDLVKGNSSYTLSSSVDSHIQMLYTNDRLAKKVERTVHIKPLFVRPKSELVTDDRKQFEYDFEANGKHWTMYYTNSVKTIRPNDPFVDNVYFIPQDYRPILDEVNTYPPELIGLRYHVVNNECIFVGAVVREYGATTNGKTEIREMKLPDDVATQLTYLIDGETKFKPSNTFAKNSEIVNTTSLLPKKVQ